MTLISKEDAIEAICDVVINEFDVCPTCGYDVAEKALSALPSVEPVKHGKWGKGYRKTANGVDFLVLSCSECDSADPQMNYYDYCPNCGAKMDKD